MIQKFSIGIDIGGTNIDWGMVTESGEVIFRQRLRTTTFNSLLDLAKKIKTIYNSKFDPSTQLLIGIGIGAPGINIVSGCIESSANLPWKGILPIKEIFNNIFNVPIYLSNDADATTIGEKIYGQAKLLKNFAVITVGTGIGAGIFLNNQIIIGNKGFGSEIGHIILIPNGRQCGCGRKGCLETYTSHKGILQNFKDLDTDNKYYYINNSKDIYDLALKNNEYAIKALSLTGELLGLAIANLITTTGIEDIILFGGPIKAGDFILQPLKQSIEKNVLHYYSNSINVLLSNLKSNDIAILGNASLAFYYNT